MVKKSDYCLQACMLLGFFISVLAILGCGLPQTDLRDSSDGTDNRHSVTRQDGSSRSSEHTQVERPGLAPRRTRSVLVMDLGVVRPVSKNTCDFRINNGTEVQWNLNSIKSNCTCAVAGLTDESIEPGRDSNLKVVFTAPDSIGDAEKHVYVQFNEAQAPVFDLVIKAKVRREITFIPNQISISNMIAGRRRYETLKIENHSGNRWKSVRLSKGDSWVKAEITNSRESKDGGQIFLIQLEIDGTEFINSDYSTELVFEAVSENGEPVDTGGFPIAVVCRPFARSIPSTLFLGRVKSGDTVQRDFQLHFAEDIPDNFLDLCRLECHDDVKIEIVEKNRKSSKVCEFVLSISVPQTSAKMFDFVADVHFNGDSQKVSLPISFAVSQ